MIDRNCARHVMVTGGVRSGKSRYAEEMAAKLGGKVTYLATAQALDVEMEERIERHQQRRPNDWKTIEEPLEVITVLSRCQKGDTVLLDCLILYLSNLFFKYAELPIGSQEQIISEKVADLAETVKRSKANVIIVTNEIGWGVVPDNSLARRFRDMAGTANQKLAAVCDEVYLLVSGLPIRIKGDNDV